MVIKNLENKIKLVLIICSLFLVGIIISISSIWTARNDGQRCPSESLCPLMAMYQSS